MAKLIQKIEKDAEASGFSSVMSIFAKDETIFSRAYGYKDIKDRLRNSIKTKFGIASGTKAFTALGIGKLIDQNVLSLDTRVGDIDKNYTTFIDEKATILNVLTHTSGIFDYVEYTSILITACIIF